VSYSAKVIADSINPFGNRLTTLQVTFPRFILAELNTHRVLSRPLEHPAQACPGRHGNFVGFKQLRKFYPYEDDYAMVLPQEQSV
jgi:hypothetical protein